MDQNVLLNHHHSHPYSNPTCLVHGFLKGLFFYSLLQENTNIEEAVRCLVEHILNNEESPLVERDPSTLVLSGYTNTTRDHFNCSSCVKWWISTTRRQPGSDLLYIHGHRDKFGSETVKKNQPIDPLIFAHIQQW